MQIYTRANFNYNRRSYTCYTVIISAVRELRIQNSDGKTLMVKQGQRFGVLQLDGESVREVDVTKPHFYNLIRIAVQALETEERNQIILEKDQLIEGQKQILESKDDQINALKQQLGILNQKLDQLSSEQQTELRELQRAIQEKEADAKDKQREIHRLRERIKGSVFVRDSNEIKEKILAALGVSVWNHLTDASQQNLILAVSNFEIVRSREFLRDYSEAVLRLGLVVEVEIISLFFDSLYSFLNKRSGTTDGIYNIGSICLRPDQNHTMGRLPRLIASRFIRFNKVLLAQEELSSEDRRNLYYSFCPREQLNDRDRELITQFLEQWNHPVGRWLLSGEPSASMLEQVRQIRNLATHPPSVHEWHFREFFKLLIEEDGLLRQAYSGTSLRQSFIPVTMSNPSRIIGIRPSQSRTS